MTLVCQDWGALIGLRVLAAMPDRFARVVAANGFLPTGDAKPNEAFLRWQTFSQTAPSLPDRQHHPRRLQDRTLARSHRRLRRAVPGRHLQGRRAQVPRAGANVPDDPAAAPNRKAWDEVLSKWEKPFLCAFSDGDPITANADKAFQSRVPGTKGMPHTTIKGGGHFLQEDCGEELAKVVVDFMRNTDQWLGRPGWHT